MSAAPTTGCDTARLLDADTWLCGRGTTLSAWGVHGGGPTWTRSFDHVVLPLVPQAGTVYASLGDEPIRQLDPATGADLRVLPAGLFPGALVASPDGARLAGWRAHHLQVWEGETSETITGCAPPTIVAAAAFDDQALWVICADFRLGRVTPADPGDAPFTRALPTAASQSGIAALAWLGDDRFAISTHRGELIVFDAAADVVVQTLQVADQGLVALATDPTHRKLAIRGERGDVWLWERGDPLSLPSTGARDLRFLADGALVVLARSHERWTLPPREPRRVLSTTAGASVLRAEPGGLIAIGTGHGHLLTWRPTEDVVADVPVFDAVIKDLAITSNQVLVTTAADFATQVRGVSRADGEITDMAGRGYLRRLQVLADDSVVAINWGGDGPLTGTLGSALDHLAWSEQPLIDLALDPTRTQVAMLDEGGRAFVGALVEGALERRWDLDVGDGSAVAIQDGVLAVGDAQGALLVPSGGAPRRLSAPALRVIGLAFSPSGRTLAGGDLSGAVWIWDVPSGALLAELRGHESRVSGLAFRSEDELVTASWDTSARRWDLGPIRADLPALRSAVAGWGLDLETVLRAP